MTMSPDDQNPKENKVGWIEFSSSRYGGAWYNRQSQKAIAKYFNLELISLEAKHLKKRRYLKFFELFYYLLQIKGQKSLWIRDFYSILSLSKRKTKGKNLALIFHIDFLSEEYKKFTSSLGVKGREQNETSSTKTA